MHTAKLTTIGNSVGIVLPKELLEKLRIGKGDVVQLLETPTGLQISPYDAEFDRQLDVAEQVMRRRRNVLRKLAE